MNHIVLLLLLLLELQLFCSMGQLIIHFWVSVNGFGMRNEATNIAQVQERIEGVDYFFLDEISMVVCHEFYKISSQLAKATNQFDLAIWWKEHDLFWRLCPVATC